MKKMLFLIAVMLLLAGAIAAANNGIRQNVRTLEPVKAATPPILDGSLNESHAWSNSRWQRDVTGERYFQTRQSFFFKVSYRYQF